jgi:hypothetical protein
MGYIYLVWAHAIVYETNNDVYFERSVYTSVEELNSNRVSSSNIQIFPNPCVNRATIIVNDKSEITLYNVQGQKIGEALKGKTNLYINTALMKNGVYFVQIKQSKRVTFQKLLVSH